jgi:DNA polymerase-3 subunit beta
MRFTISREKLQEGLTAVAASIPAKTTLPVLANILVETTERGIRLSGTDLDIAVSTEVVADVETSGAITIPAKKLSEIARELPPAPVKIGAMGEQRITLECGRSKFKLLGLPRDEFPTFPQVRFQDSWRIRSGDLQKLISHTSFAVSTEESRPILNGVLWELRADHMRMVATNGHRLTRMDLPTGSSNSPSGDLIVPPKALDQVRRLFPAEEDLEIAQGDNHLGFRSPFTSVFTRLIEGPYPNYEQVIPRDNDRVAISDKVALISALKRMSVIASDQTHRIRLSFNAGLLRFSVQTPDLGEAQDELPIRIT